MCRDLLREHVRVIAIVHIIIVCIGAILLILTIENIPAWQGVIIALVYITLVFVYILCLYGSINCKRWMLIPFVILKSMEIIAILCGIVIGMERFDKMNGIQIKYVFSFSGSLLLAELYFILMVIRYFNQITDLNRAIGIEILGYELQPINVSQPTHQEDTIATIRYLPRRQHPTVVQL